MLDRETREQLRELESDLQKRLDRLMESKRAWTNLDASRFRQAGIAAYLGRGDVERFRECLRNAARARISHIRLREPITETNYENGILSAYKIYDAFAAGDIELARELASVIVNETDTSVSVHPVAKQLVWLAIYSALGDDVALASQSRELTTKFSKRNRNWLGYGEFMSALCAGDTVAMQHAVTRIIAGHVKEGRRGTYVDSPDDRALCVRGVGVVNLARARGFHVQAADPLIPSDLMIKVCSIDGADHPGSEVPPSGLLWG